MKYYKEQCEALTEAGAFILLRDGFTENGTPIYVTRKTIGCYGIKYGRGSEWGIFIDKALCNGAKRVPFKLIKGWNINGHVVVFGLISDMERFASSLTPDQVDMIVSDAQTRLKMASEPESYDAKVKPEEVEFQKVEKMLSAISYGKFFTCHSPESGNKYIDLVTDLYKELIRSGETEQTTRRYLRSFGIPYNVIFKVEYRLRLQYSLV